MKPIYADGNPEMPMLYRTPLGEEPTQVPFIEGVVINSVQFIKGNRLELTIDSKPEVPYRISPGILEDKFTPPRIDIGEDVRLYREKEFIENANGHPVIRGLSGIQVFKDGKLLNQILLGNSYDFNFMSESKLEKIKEERATLLSTE
ncbi:MAG: hypothetical protein GY861_23545 [bacterium]|nr:hypothetical protein [bacterium]